MLNIPEKIVGRTGGTCVIGTGLINNGKLQIPALRLCRPCDRDMHPVRFAVAICIKGGFHPEVVPDPLLGILKFGNDLRLTILDEEKPESGRESWRTQEGSD